MKMLYKQISFGGQKETCNLCHFRSDFRIDSSIGHLLMKKMIGLHTKIYCIVCWILTNHNYFVWQIEQSNKANLC